MKKTFASSLLFVLVALTSGCFLQNRTDSGSATNEVIQSEKAPSEVQPSPPAKVHGIEVTWEMPAEPVDGFIIRYGDTPSSLSKEVTIQRADIREENDPEFGPVYRYLIRDVDGSKKLFVSIAAVKGQTVSDFSQVLEAQAD